MIKTRFSGIIAAFAAAVFVCAASLIASAADKCGVVENLTQSVTVIRDKHETELSEGDALYSGDMLKAGQTGYAEIKLIDDTLIALGGNSMIALTEVSFNAARSRLHVSVDNGAVWVSIGSIGLVDANAVKFSTPSLLVSSDNATLQFEVGGEETLKVQWMNKGGKVEVYNNRTKEKITLREMGVILSVPREGEMIVSADTAPTGKTP